MREEKKRIIIQQIKTWYFHKGYVSLYMIRGDGYFL
jgi:hypothetical protein